MVKVAGPTWDDPGSNPDLRKFARPFNVTSATFFMEIVVLLVSWVAGSSPVLSILVVVVVVVIVVGSIPAVVF